MKKKIWEQKYWSSQPIYALELNQDTPHDKTGTGASMTDLTDFRRGSSYGTCPLHQESSQYIAKESWKVEPFLSNIQLLSIMCQRPRCTSSE